MIHADLRGKSHVAEDVLTSNCLDLLRLLPDKDFIGFLQAAAGLNGETLDLSSINEVKRIVFWPWLPNGGEPDVIIELKHRNTLKNMVIVIEAKHGAGKSVITSSLQTDANLSDDPNHIEAKEFQHALSDQLARYWQSANNRYKSEIVLIYLTHHRSLPKEDIQTSLYAAGKDAKILWLSWFHLYRLGVHWSLECNRPTTERRVLKTLHNYLSAKGYACFLGWAESQSIIQTLQFYSRFYFLNAGHKTSILYNKKYILCLPKKFINQNYQRYYYRKYYFNITGHCHSHYNRIFQSNLKNIPIKLLSLYKNFEENI